MVFVFLHLERWACCELERHCISSRVCWIGKVFSWVSMWIPNSLSSRKRVLAVGDLEHAWYVSFGRLRKPPFLVTIYLVSPWYTLPNCPTLLRVWLSSLLMHVT